MRTGNKKQERRRKRRRQCLRAFPRGKASSPAHLKEFSEKASKGKKNAATKPQYGSEGGGSKKGKNMSDLS